MAISGVNQSKNNVVSQSGARKAGIYLWGDTEATWGDTIATWGGVMLTPVNQDKSPNGSTTTVIGSPIGLLLALTYATEITAGSGFVNQSKS